MNGQIGFVRIAAGLALVAGVTLTPKASFALTRKQCQRLQTQELAKVRAASQNLSLTAGAFFEARGERFSTEAVNMDDRAALVATRNAYASNNAAYGSLWTDDIADLDAQIADIDQMLPGLLASLDASVVVAGKALQSTIQPAATAFKSYQSKIAPCVKKTTAKGGSQNATSTQTNELARTYIAGAVKLLGTLERSSDTITTFLVGSGQTERVQATLQLNKRETSLLTSRAAATTDKQRASIDEQLVELRGNRAVINSEYDELLNPTGNRATVRDRLEDWIETVKSEKVPFVNKSLGQVMQDLGLDPDF